MTNPKSYKTFTIRFRKTNKREAAILRVLEDLNLDVHKSVNQFVVDAVEYYFDDRELIGPTADAGKQRYVTRTELEEVVSNLDSKMQETKEEIKSQVYEDVIKVVLGSTMVSGNTMLAQMLQGNSDTQPVSEQTYEEDDSLLDDVMKWS